LSEAEDISEALWEVGRLHGVKLSVADQVSLSRTLSGSPVTAPAVTSAFTAHGLAAPSRAFVTALVQRIGRVVPRRGLREVLLEYRNFAIRELSGQFGGKTKGREEELRNNLLTFLPQRGYTEARTGRGRTDILLPSPKRIIEVKVWTSALTYEDGLVELGRYIQTEEANEAYMVVFGDRQPLPSIISDADQAVAEERSISGLLVPTFVVPFEVEPPSKVARLARKRAHGES
jgi:hypothetical protein